VANDDSEGLDTPGATPVGTWQGLFAVDRIGGPVTIADEGGLGISMNGEVFFGGGRLFSGQWSLPTG
jgi:hypothetical protein